MGTYYNNGNNNNNVPGIGGGSSDGLQTLILMNSATPYQYHHNNSNNLVYINSVPRATHHAPNHQEHLVGIPLDPHHQISALHHAFMPRVAHQGGLSLGMSDPPSRSSPGSEVLNKVNSVVNGVRSDGVVGSRYLKAAQELLNEVVSVEKEVVIKVSGDGGSGGGGGGERSGKSGGGEMSTAERQEIQTKKAKLVGMLDEVEQRYRQYHNQMQIVISWFEQATGTGSAKTYTSLALQTISKQSRCLKDAISAQIQESSKSLGEEGSFGCDKKEGSRLKFLDNQIRQQRAMQQLGMIQPNAWRPQRGLPERSVSILRAWLFEHFLHPYPKDSDKIILAKQTGLTRSQVSNWFINARVRLWKPMVEEMYIEEIKDQEKNKSDEKTIKSENDTNEDSCSKTTTHLNKNPANENQNMNFKSLPDIPTNQNSPSPTGINIRNQPGFNLIWPPAIENISQENPKKPRNNEYLQSSNGYFSNEQISMKFDDERENGERFSLIGGSANFIGGFGAYPIGEIGRFGNEQFSGTYSGNGVSLTLGLPHDENVSISGAHQSFYQNQNIQMGRRLEIGESNEFANVNNSSPSHSSIDYERINIQNRKRYATQLLPDFVT